MPHGTLLNIVGWAVFVAGLLVAIVSSEWAMYIQGAALGLFVSGIYATFMVDRKGF